jgi:cytochrome c oxidase subunit 3
MSSSTHDDGHDHPEWLAHHFETPEQQFEAGKFGMWVFLVTEVLFFSGLFCAYTYYRGSHPEMFIDAHFFLSTKMGAINTVVLILSSFTMATAVRNAQMENRKWLIRNLVITLVCAFGFLVIKAFEYSHKLHIGLKWGSSYSPNADALKEYNEAMVTAGRPVVDNISQLPDLHQFFSIYYCMTGLHGIHVVLGIVAISLLLRRAIRGDFNRYYFTAVDGVGLYWHLVDLIWIFLFPLMYLIH